MDTNSEMHTHSNFYAMLTAACQKNSKGTVIFNDKEKISYSSLKREVETVAAYLQHEGVQYGDKVALVVSNSPEFITAYFAITSIGAVAVPLNVFLKSEEFSYILNDCGARFMFASASLAKELKNIKAKTKVNKIIWIGETKAASSDD
ncbi:AMP-binding protein, partial [Neisseria sp. P0021.S006]